ASIMLTPMRSLTLDAGLKNSNLARTVAPAPSTTRLRRTSGVFPIRSIMLLATFMIGSLGSCCAARLYPVNHRLSRQPVLRSWRLVCRFRRHHPDLRIIKARACAHVSLVLCGDLVDVAPVVAGFGPPAAGGQHCTGHHPGRDMRR